MLRFISLDPRLRGEDGKRRKTESGGRRKAEEEIALYSALQCFGGMDTSLRWYDGGLIGERA